MNKISYNHISYYQMEKEKIDKNILVDIVAYELNIYVGPYWVFYWFIFVEFAALSATLHYQLYGLSSLVVIFMIMSYTYHQQIHNDYIEDVATDLIDLHYDLEYMKPDEIKNVLKQMTPQQHQNIRRKF